MNNKQKILSVLTTAEICDDCLSHLSGVLPRQTVYIVCRSLSDSFVILRQQGICTHCLKSKLVSRHYDDQASTLEGVASPHFITSETGGTAPWFWEGNVQEKVVSYLTQNGYTIRRVTDTASRAPGIDIVAVTPTGQELWVSVKGYPEKNSNTQARHWFSGAIFDLVLYRGENPKVHLAVAFPDGFVTYGNLLPRVEWLKQTIPFEVYWVSKEGTVRKE
ncbi:hypothetical protein [Tumebacillus permanentifrigoris]|uniref:Restriction endonuclease n=1 Tax=Tumebacillus permanentifrigoris TaxID=378543 RepID=A0A316DG43_9BACL|nr:hypothetical protein [Tumebacillus permanentifrigoris]PWK16502.1 hypothetical protein C7459_101366 [Tumebacillus permanentifrigoris]